MRRSRPRAAPVLSSVVLDGQRLGARLRSAPLPAPLLTAMLVAALAALAALAACGGPSDPGGGRHAAGAGATRASTPIALAPDGRTLWVVNPDADSVTALSVADLAAGVPIPVGREPWGLVVAPDGVVVVMNRRDGSLTFLDGAEGQPRRLGGDLPVGPEPGGLALSSDGRLAFVTVSSDAEVAVVDVAARRVVERIPVGPLPWAVAASGDSKGKDEGETVIVSHRLALPVEGGGTTRNDDREGRLTLISGAGGPVGGVATSAAPVSSWEGVAAITEVALAPSAYGFPNALESLAVVSGPAGGPAHDVVYVAHLLNSPEPPNDFQTTVSGGLSAVAIPNPVAGPAALPQRSLDLNDPGFSTPVNFPRAVAASPAGDALYLALAGSDAVMGVDISDPAAPRLLGFWPTGRNPRGLVVSADGARAYVMNYLSRDVSVLDLADPRRRREVARVAVVDETLPSEVLRGKVLFNNASDPRLSRNGWLSCASCHVGGGSDGTTWPREEGARQTMPLWSLAGTAPFHSAATRDEIQDFEVDIERFMAGVGLAPGAVGPLLGAPSAGSSADLDALAAFVLTGIRPPAAPSGDAAAQARGRSLFTARACQSCHAGPAWTTSRLPVPVGTPTPGDEQVVAAVLHDVGTFDPLADVTGELGFDVPTLLGLARTAPYFHGGSAAELGDVLAHRAHSGAPFTPSEASDLVAFLLSIDADTEPFALP